MQNQTPKRGHGINQEPSLLSTACWIAFMLVAVTLTIFIAPLAFNG